MKIESELAKLREQNRQLIAENERRSAEVAFLHCQLTSVSVGISHLSDSLHSLHSAVCMLGGLDLPSNIPPEQLVTASPSSPSDSARP